MKRRVFFGGLDTEKRNCMGLDDDDYPMFDFTSKDSSIKRIHIPYPDNLVIADYDWFVKNFDKVKLWHETAKGSEGRDCFIWNTVSEMLDEEEKEYEEKRRV